MSWRPEGKAGAAEAGTAEARAREVSTGENSPLREDVGTFLDAISATLAATWGINNCEVHEHCDGSCSGPQITHQPLVSERNLLNVRAEQTPQKVDLGTVCRDEQWLESQNFPLFKYEQLPKSPATVRLLRVKQAVFRADIVECDLVTAALDDHPAFTVLSFSRGEPLFDTPILCDCKRLCVTATLAATLKAYRRLGLCQRGILVWVDALCVNQTDKEELNSQIPLKRRIYSQADTVHVHLGEIGNEWYQGFDLMTRFSFAYEYQQALKASRSLTLDQIWNLYQLPSRHHPAWTQYRKVFNSVWFRRMWILEDVAMAKEVTMTFGRFAFPWTLFLQSSRFLTESRIFPPTFTSTSTPVNFRNEIPIRTSPVTIRETGLDVSGNTFPFCLCQHCRSFSLTVASFVVPPHHPCLEGCESSTIESLTTRPFEQLQESAQQNCRICRLIQRAVTRAYPAEAAIPDVKCEIRKKVHRRFDTHQPVKHRVLQALLHYGEPRIDKETPTVELLPVESNEAPGVFPGRHLDPNGIDYSLVKDWMQECQRTHGSMCKYSLNNRFKEIAPYFRVIDITNGCLTHLPLGSRYVALSYVWGNTTDAFTTLKSNVNRLTEPGTFDDVLSNSPSVISDAFDFVRNIGEQYLWVDRICIVQDDDEEKQKIIHLMDLVYENAFITLFAAAGKDANTGLPGVGQNSRGCQQLIDGIGPGLELMVPLDLGTLMTSTWATRAWTYQEFFFSKRRLIFIGGQVVYICRTKSYREDVRVQHVDLSQTFWRTTPTDWEATPHPRSLQPVEQRLWFMEYVQAFSKRQLTYDNDVLNAFAGIIDFMSNEMSFKTHFGLLLATLDLDVLWQPNHFLQRRRGFPSWSWAGWKGSILVARAGERLFPGIQNIRKRYTQRNAFLARLFLVPFYTYEEEHQCFRLTSVNFNEFTKRRLEDPWAFYRETTIRDHESAIQAQIAPVTPMNGQDEYPPVAREKDCSFDPRSGELKVILSQINSPFPKYLVSARPPPEVTSRLTSQTLLLHTLTTRIFVSTLNQRGSRCKPASTREPLLSTTPCIYFYDENGDPIGLGWFCEEYQYNRLAKICEESQDRKWPPRRPQVEVAFLSGPIRGSWRHEDEWDIENLLMAMRLGMQQFGAGSVSECYESPAPRVRDPDSDLLDKVLEEKPWEGVSLDTDDKDTGEDKLKYCQVMLLCNVDPSGEYDLDYAKREGDPWQIKERVGLGEIREDVIAGLRDIAWRDVILQ